eukprot:symbB.v1.2.030150.t1/scaffold3362.1/size63757/3
MAPLVCVIGAGPAGLTTLKQLQDVGVTELECFEKDTASGGLFNYGPNKTGVHRCHWHHSEYRRSHFPK